MEKISVIGLGYVGSALASFLGVNYSVKVYDKDLSKGKLLSSNQSPVSDLSLINFLSNNTINITYSNSLNDVCANTDIIYLALPTDFNEGLNSFDTSIIDETLNYLNKKNYPYTVVIRSTVPLGYTDSVSSVYSNLNILYCPEFLREGPQLMIPSIHLELSLEAKKSMLKNIKNIPYFIKKN